LITSADPAPAFCGARPYQIALHIGKAAEYRQHQEV
jgi:hypothetical protein